MKKTLLFVWALALLGIGAAHAAGQFPGYPQATSSPTTGNAATLPLTGNELIPADTQLPNGVQPQTEVISTSQLKTYILNLPQTTIAALPTCSATTFGYLAAVSNGTAYATGTYGSAVSATGAVTRVVVCTNTGGATTYAWAYN